MARRVVTHPGLSLIVLSAVTVAGSISVSSTVEFLAVGTSWLGLDSFAGVCVSVACSILALAAVAFLAFSALSDGDGEDDAGGGDDDEPPAPEGPSGEPAWWPRFEQDFTAYAREPERSRSGRETRSPIASDLSR